MLAKPEEKTGLFRTLLEMSTMANNTEFVIHSTAPLRNPGEFEGDGYHKYLREEIKLSWDLFDDPSPYFSREILPVEIEEGLDPRFNDYLSREKTPEITRTIDGLFKLLQSVQNQITFGITPTQALVHYIAGHYYDCMSGGMPGSALLMARELIVRYNVDRSTQVYPKTTDDPKEDAWVTVQDFLDETKNVESLEILKKLPPGLFKLEDL